MNAPVQARVRVGPNGAPSTVVLEGRTYPVATVHERWRIDEGWWWARPVSRRYWRLVLADGRLLTVYQDLEETPPTWWAQRA